jgi:hypothetical protein
MVVVDKPAVSYLKSEYVFDSDSLFIYGNSFYGDTSTIKVSFAGRINLQCKAECFQCHQMLRGSYCEGANRVMPGPITVATLYGSSTSDLWFRDNRNIILGFENMSGSNGQGANQGALWHPQAGDFDHATSSAP